MEGEVFHFPVLNFNSISARIFQYTDQRIKASDLSDGNKVDELLCHFFGHFFAISLDPLNKTSYVCNVMRILSEMNYPESFTISDFGTERDSRKMSRILSWLFQFFETLQPAHTMCFEYLKKIKVRHSEALALKSKIDTLKISNRSDDEKRVEYQNRIDEFRNEKSKLYSKKAQVDEEEGYESRKLSQLLDAEKTNSQETEVLMIRLEELKANEENLRSKIIDDPNLPQTIQELQEKANALEVEMQESRSKIFQSDQTINQYKQLHEDIKHKLIAVSKECKDCLQAISRSKMDLAKWKSQIATHAAERENLVKKITEMKDALHLSEHKLVKERVLDASEITNDERIKKEKTARLEKFCNACKSLNDDLEKVMAVVDTTKAQYEQEYNDTEREECERTLEHIRNTLNQLYNLYNENRDCNFVNDDQ